MYRMRIVCVRAKDGGAAASFRENEIIVRATGCIQLLLQYPSNGHNTLRKCGNHTSMAMTVKRKETANVAISYNCTSRIGTKLTEHA